MNGTALKDLRARRALRVVVAVTLAATLLPLTGTATAAAREHHTVRRGDTLRSIACENGLYGRNAWRRIYNLNRKLDHPERLPRRDTLRIPRRRENIEPRPLPRGYTRPPQDRSTVSSGSDKRCVWDRLARCESGGNWRINTGNGYYGGVQFSRRSWWYVGGDGYPHRALRKEQIYRAEKLRREQGWRAWPACSRRTGIR